MTEQVKGYTPLKDIQVSLVNVNKEIEESVLRIIDDLQKNDDIDKRWLAIAKTNIEQGFMAMNRAIFKPQRVEL